MLRPLFLALLVLGGCASAPPGDAPPRTVEAVDLDRYAGVWHEAARFPNWFQDGTRVSCADTTATYTPRPGGRVGVVNRCRNALAGGAERVAEGRAYVVDGSNGARLRVSFFWPFYGDYWVIGLSPDYRWAVVGDPRREYLWVLSRSPAMSEADYAAALAIARREGFDTARLRPTARLGA